MDDLTDVLCGKSRPTHFAGVLLVVLKLLNQVAPDAAYFGRKDYQQVLVIKRMVKDLDLLVHIKACPIVREEDGLALSSRNCYLTDSERADAPLLRSSLIEVNRLFKNGERNVAVLLSCGLAVLKQSELLKVDYLEIRDPEMLALREETANKGDLVAVAAFLGKARLIDNLLLDGEPVDQRP
jgi:pantoate--beta-alanine ligase